jgi:hypothetical protein
VVAHLLVIPAGVDLESGAWKAADRMILTAISIALACAAFLFSIFTWRERRSQDQRDLFLKMHERLIDIDLQRGRRVLAQSIRSTKDAQALFRDSPERYDLANRALAMLDVAALYVEHRYIDKSLFMDEWGSVYGRILESAQYFIADRDERNPISSHGSWPHFQLLAHEARRYTVTRSARPAD